MRPLIAISIFLFSLSSHASTILDSVFTKAGPVEVWEETENGDPSLYIAQKKVHQYDRRPVSIYAVFRLDGIYGDEIVVVSDCGVDNCSFRILFIDENGKFRMTDAFGNGNDHPNISYDGKILTMDFGIGRRSVKSMRAKFDGVNLKVLEF